MLMENAGIDESTQAHQLLRMFDWNLAIAPAILSQDTTTVWATGARRRLGM
jgi:hypothetical protein